MAVIWRERLTAEMLADPEFVRQFVDEAISDAVRRRSLDSLLAIHSGRDLNEANLEALVEDVRLYGQAFSMGGIRMPLASLYLDDDQPEDAAECAECGAPCDPRELFCNKCLEVGAA